MMIDLQTSLHCRTASDTQADEQLPHLMVVPYFD